MSALALMIPTPEGCKPTPCTLNPGFYPFAGAGTRHQLELEVDVPGLSRD
jgi:hypothetical protein